MLITALLLIVHLIAPAEVQTERYDVTSFLTPMPTFEVGAVLRPGVAEGEPPIVEVPEPVGLRERVVDFAQDVVPSAEVTLQEQHLVVTATPIEHATLTRELKQWQDRARNTQIAVNVRILMLDGEPPEALRPQLRQVRADPARAVAIDRDLAGVLVAGADSVSSPRVVIFDQQPAWIAVLEEQPLPDGRTLQLGQTITVKAGVDPDDLERVAAHLTFEHAELAAPLTDAEPELRRRTADVLIHSKTPQEVHLIHVPATEPGGSAMYLLVRLQSIRQHELK